MKFVNAFLFAPKKRHPVSGRTHRTLLSVENLETRAVPTVLTTKLLFDNFDNNDSNVFSSNWSVVQGATHVVRPDYDRSIEKPLNEYFDRYLTVRMENFKLADEEIIRGDKGSIVVQPTRARVS